MPVTKVTGFFCTSLPEQLHMIVPASVPDSEIYGEEAYVMLPQDPIILLSYVNTKLRDRDHTLENFCAVEDVDQAELCSRLAEVGYTYDTNRAQFV